MSSQRHLSCLTSNNCLSNTAHFIILARVVLEERAFCLHLLDSDQLALHPKITLIKRVNNSSAENVVSVSGNRGRRLQRQAV
jgi:hypothetical protein